MTDNIISFSEERGALFKALAEAQAEISNPTFDKNNSHFGSKYASLTSVLDAVRKVFPKHGLSIIQGPECDGQVVSVETIIGHASGQWVSCTLSIPTGKPGAHAIGSAITYAKRFTAQAMAGVAADDDDDGNAAVEGDPKPAQRRQPKKVDPRSADLKKRSTVALAKLEHMDPDELNAELKAIKAAHGDDHESAVLELEEMGAAFEAGDHWPMRSFPLSQEEEAQRQGVEGADHA